VQRISNCDEIHNSSRTPDKILNVLMYGSLRASMISGMLKNGLVQRIFNRDKVQDSSLTPDNALSILIFVFLRHIHELYEL